MKKIHLHKLCLFFLVAALAFSFTSCEEDDYTVRSTLDISSANLSGDRNGTFSYYFDIYVGDIKNVDASRRDIIEARLYSSLFYVNGINRSLRLGDIVDLTLETDRGGIFRLQLPVYIDQNGDRYAYLDERTNGYALFMEDLANKVIAYGNVRLIVSGQFTDSQGYIIPNVPFWIDIKNDLDVLVRG